MRGVGISRRRARIEERGRRMGAARLRDLTHWFVLLAVLDLGMTLVVLGLGGHEANPVARLVLDAAIALRTAGREPTLASLLLELTDPRLHGLLVQLDETTRSQTHLDQTGRVHHLDAAITRRRADRTAQRNLRTLKTSPLQPDDEAAILEQLVAARREAQGMTDPKEG